MKREAASLGMGGVAGATPAGLAGLGTWGRTAGYANYSRLMLGGEGGATALASHKNFGKAIREAGVATEKTTKYINVFGMKLSYATAGLMAFGAAAIKFTERIFHYGSLIEQSKMVLTSVYGSERRAINTIKGMREFSRKTQFLPEQIVSGTTMMAKYNITPFEKGQYGLDKKHSVMDLMAGLGAMPGPNGPIGLSRAINAVIGGRDIRVMKQFGGPVMAAYKKALKAGTSASPEYHKVMLEELAKIPSILALANAQLNTMSGMWSTITGYVEEMFMDISGAGEERGVLTFWSQLKQILFEIRNVGGEVADRLGPFFREFGAFLGSGFKAAFELVKSLFIILSPFFSILKEVFKILFQVGIFINQTLVKGLKFFIQVLEKIANLFGVGGAIQGLIHTLRLFILGLEMTFKALGLYIDVTFEKLAKGLDDLYKKIEPIITLLKNSMSFLTPFLPGVGAITSAYTLSKQITPEQKEAYQEWKKKGGLKNNETLQSLLPMWLRMADEQIGKGPNLDIGNKLLRAIDNLNNNYKNGAKIWVDEKSYKELIEKASGR